MIVGHHGAIYYGEIQGGKGIGVRCPAHRQQHLFAPGHRRLTLESVVYRQAGFLRLQLRHNGAGFDADALALEAFANQGRRLGVFPGEHLVPGLQHRNLHPQGSHHGGTFQADDPAAQDDQAFGQGFDGKKPIAGEDPAAGPGFTVNAWNPGQRRPGSRGQDKPVPADDNRAVIGGYGELPGSPHRPPAPDPLHPGGGQELLHPGAQVFDDAVLAPKGRVPADSLQPGIDAELRRPAQGRDGGRRLHQGFGWDAPPVQAHAPHLPVFHQGHGAAEAGGAEGRRVPRRSAPQDRHIHLEHRHLSPPSRNSSRPPPPRSRQWRWRKGAGQPAQIPGR